MPVTVSAGNYAGGEGGVNVNSVSCVGVGLGVYIRHVWLLGFKQTQRRVLCRRWAWGVYPAVVVA